MLFRSLKLEDLWKKFPHNPFFGDIGGTLDGVLNMIRQYRRATGEHSADETERKLARLRSCVEQLEREKRCLELEVEGFERELADLKAAAKSPAECKSGFRCSICHENKPATLRQAFICDECVHVFDVREAMPTPEDGLDIPAPMRRDKKEVIT